VFEDALVYRPELLHGQIAVIDVFGRAAVAEVHVRHEEDDVRDDAVGQPDTREDRRRCRVEQAAVVRRNAEAVVALPDRLENAVEARPEVFHAIGKRRASSLFLRHVEPQTGQRVIGVWSRLVGQQVSILGVEDEEQPIEEDQRALAQSSR
jgi:hypothetical protein